MVLLIMAVVVLPLTAAVVTIAIGGARLRIEATGQSLRAAAASAAAALATTLVGDIDKLHVALEHEPVVVDWLSKEPNHLSVEQRGELDRQWPTLPTDSGPVAEVLHNPIANQLRLLQEDDKHIAEIMVTDRDGQLVAATGRTSSFYQADKDWWKQCTSGSAGKIVIPPIGFDSGIGVWSVNLCFPIHPPHGGKIIGTARAVLDISRWIMDLEKVIGGMPAQIMLMKPDGTVIYLVDNPRGPVVRMIPDLGRIDPFAAPAWCVTHNGFIVAYAPIPMPAEVASQSVDMAPWVLVKYVPERATLGQVYRLAAILLVAGVVIVGGVFVVGFSLADRELVTRIQALAAATRRVAEGDLMHRLLPRKRHTPLGRDEIDELTEDFNRMVERIHQSYAELKASDELKANFIRIASHEFRTPISYILGVAKLLKDSQDPDKLLQALQTVSGKARRLDEITQAMFKLMPESPRAALMQYQDVTLGELLEEIRLDVFPFLSQRDQRLILRIARDVPVIRADRNKLKDAITNLVTNAIKFTRDGGEVCVDVSRRSAHTVLIAVSDQGPGIPQADLPHIFEPFFSGTDTLTHSSGDSGYLKRGIGLGLTIVKYFVELHGGTVSVSTGSWGSIFSVEIPITPQARRWSEEVQI
jgi:signal transduction histidine kinase